MNNQELIRYNSQTAVIQLPRFDYVNWLLKKGCFEELWELFRDSDSPAKEMSESYSAFQNLKKICQISNLNWIHIGDGSRARTGALFTLFTKCNNVSIDPTTRTDLLYKWVNRWKIERFNVFKEKYEDVDMNLINEFLDTDKQYGITCVHAHVKLDEVDKKFPNWKYIYTSLCCKPNEQRFSEQYIKENNIIEIVNKLDMNILSERREYVVYKKLNNV
jgi:hypothetical protein